MRSRPRTGIPTLGHPARWNLSSTQLVSPSVFVTYELRPVGGAAFLPCWAVVRTTGAHTAVKAALDGAAIAVEVASSFRTKGANLLPQSHPSYSTFAVFPDNLHALAISWASHPSTDRCLASTSTETAMGLMNRYLRPVRGSTWPAP